MAATKSSTDKQFRSKRYKASAAKAVPTAVPLDAGVAILKGFPPTKFDQSIELIFSLGVDPKHADQAVRSSISLPHGVGKSKRVIAFCDGAKTGEAVNAGAIRAGGEELVNAILGENFTDFDVAVAEPAMMRFVGKLGKLLGPKGLMPSPKAGTVTPNVENAVREYAAGKLEFRADSGGNVHTVIGKMSFDNDKIAENANAMIATIHRVKPQAAKGQYIKSVTLKGSMTPAVPLAVS